VAPDDKKTQMGTGGVVGAAVSAEQSPRIRPPTKDPNRPITGAPQNTTDPGGSAKTEFLDPGSVPPPNTTPAPRIAGQLLPWSRTKRIFLQICAALAAAHKRGIVHRDLKPENVFLVDFLGDPDFVKLLDFGIAQIIDRDGMSGAGARVTQAGTVIGTPEYMSPEQVRGEVPDRRADIYALGCLLYEMLTGQPPFTGDSFMAIAGKQMFEVPEPPGHRRKAALPRDLQSACLRALQKDPALRFQSMDEMLASLLPPGTTEDEAPVPQDLPAVPTVVNRTPSAPSAAEVARPQAPPLPVAYSPQMAMPFLVPVSLQYSSVDLLGEAEDRAGADRSKALFLAGSTAILAVAFLVLALLFPGWRGEGPPTLMSALDLAKGGAESAEKGAMAEGPSHTIPVIPPDPGTATRKPGAMLMASPARLRVARGTAGATVVLDDGEELGVTPLDVEIPLARGQDKRVARLLLRKPGCKPYQASVVLRSGATTEQGANLHCRAALADAKAANTAMVETVETPAPDPAPPIPGGKNGLRNPFGN
jgi:serine/threonine-protein kinase